MINEGTASDADAEELRWNCLTAVARLGANGRDEDRRENQHRLDRKHQPTREAAAVSALETSTAGGRIHRFRPHVLISSMLDLSGNGSNTIIPLLTIYNSSGPGRLELLVE